jgi:hypothetical protein
MDGSRHAHHQLTCKQTCELHIALLPSSGCIYSQEVRGHVDCITAIKPLRESCATKQACQVQQETHTDTRHPVTGRPRKTHSQGTHSPLCRAAAMWLQRRHANALAAFSNYPTAHNRARPQSCNGCQTILVRVTHTEESRSQRQHTDRFATGLSQHQAHDTCGGFACTPTDLYIKTTSFMLLTASI